MSNSNRPSVLRLALRWTGRVIAVVVVLILVAVTVVYAATERRMRRSFSVPAHQITVVADSASAARGERIATIRACTGCHGPQLVGHTEIDEPLIGRVSAPNLTMGGRGAQLTDADWERAVRHGVKRDGSPLLIMPAFEHNGMSDQDLTDIVAYARSIPPAATVMPAPRAGPILRVAFFAGQAELLSAEMIDHARPHTALVVPEPTAQYGAYFATMCTGCHGPNFAGGKIPAGPPDWGPASNLTPTGLAQYTEADFIKAMRTGVRPGGSEIRAPMPWKNFASMTDVELRAIFAYLQTLPPREFGSR